MSANFSPDSRCPNGASGLYTLRERFNPLSRCPNHLVIYVLCRKFPYKRFIVIVNCDIFFLFKQNVSSIWKTFTYISLANVYAKYCLWHNNCVNILNNKQWRKICLTGVQIRCTERKVINLLLTIKKIKKWNMLRKLHWKRLKKSW